jgi:hypothetical protein
MAKPMVTTAAASMHSVINWRMRLGGRSLIVRTSYQGVREGAIGDTPYSLGSRRAHGETGPEVRTIVWGDDGGPGGRAGVGWVAARAPNSSHLDSERVEPFVDISALFAAKCPQ